MKLTTTFLTLLFPVLVFSQVDGEIMDAPSIEDSEIILSRAEQMPVAPGCELSDPYRCTEMSILDFIKENLSIPDSIKQDENMHGVCYIQFIVNEEGAVEDVKILRSIGRRIEDPTDQQMEAIKVVETAAVDVVKKLKFRLPASENGQPVKVQEVVPVRVR